MATYKVIQDIEAEDKLVGPLSLRQFVYAGICVVCLYLSFIVATKGLAPAVALFIPPAALFGFLAFPWSGEQPTEVWALAKVNFLVKPRKRIWNQSGVKELVTITAPKVVETTYTNGLSQTEVKSRLRALADTIDSRGWVIKNVNGPMYGQMAAQQQNSQRLVGIAAAVPEAEQFVEQPSEDVFDTKNNPVAQKFDNMIQASEKAHRQQLMDQMNAPDLPAAPAPVQAVPVAQPQAPANNYWFLNQPAQSGASVPQDTVTFNTQVVAPGAPVTALPVAAAAPTPAEEAFIKQLKNEPIISPNMHGHLHVIQPLSAQQNGQGAPSAPVAQVAPASPTAIQNQPYYDPSLLSQPAPQPQMPAQTVAQNTPAPTTPQAAPQQQVTPATDAAILDLARNDDLNVATIAREAQKRKESPDEVVISLH